MIFFWTILALFFLISLIFIIICLSNLEIEIEKFNFNSNNKKIKDYLVYIKLKIFSRITWIKITIDDDKIKKIGKYKIINNKILDKIDNFKLLLIENIKAILKEGTFKHIKKPELNVKRINLKIELGTLNVIFTSIIVTIISTFLSVFLTKTIDKYNNKNCKYTITPIYSGKSQISIRLNCIINVKMVHIINILFMLFKKRSVNYDERTSNRRSYACRHG